MPEAVIVSAARTPIGRANKGSLKDFRPHDLSALIIKAALDKIPELDPNDVNDLMLGCGLPGGEAGNNMARVVTTLLGYEIPGTTLTRYCASSVQTSRMAFHAIKAGEGDVYISAGVETVSRYQFGTSDHIPNTNNPKFDDLLKQSDSEQDTTKRKALLDQIQDLLDQDPPWLFIGYTDHLLMWRANVKGVAFDKRVQTEWGRIETAWLG